MKTKIKPERPIDLPTGEWSEQSMKVLEERYLQKDENEKIIETPADMCWRVSWEIASAEAAWGAKKQELLETAKKFYELLVSRKFLPNSPTLMNAGTGNNLQYSACFVLPVEDSLVGIFDAIKYQALIHQTGGGTGFSFSRLRPKGAIVRSSHGTASGPVSFMKVFDAATNEIKQGGRRRGANMGILRVDHPDVLDFIHCKETGGITNFNISVAITDEFMKAYYEDAEYDLIDPKKQQVIGSLSARKVFDEIAESAWKSGDPGIIFIDRANQGEANPVPSLGPIEATNPCVTGDTLVYTDNGLVRMKYLVGNPLGYKVLIGKFFNKPTEIFKTGNKEVFLLTTKQGYELKLTKDHKVLTSKGWIAAKDLTNIHKIKLSTSAGGFGMEGNLDEGQILGWLVGDGTLKASSAVLSFFGREKEEIAESFANKVSYLVAGTQRLNRDYPINVVQIKERNEARVSSVRLWRYAVENGIEPGNKLHVPERVYVGTKEMQVGFLQALFSADGHVEGNPDKGVSVRLTSTSLVLLKGVQNLLLNLGIVSRIHTKRRLQSYRDLPDGRGGKKSYLCKEYHDLAISKSNLKIFAQEVGFLITYKNAKLMDSLLAYKEGNYSEKYEANFEKLTLLGKEDVYDLIEPVNHSFIANGLVVHNCGEQPLYPYDACNLGSIFLNFFVNDKGVDWEGIKNITKIAIRFLDDVIEVNPFPLIEIRKTVLSIRRVGLGVGGWADMLTKLNIPYDSEEALQLAEQVMKVIKQTAVSASQELARKRGAFPLWKQSIYKSGKPRRNSTVTTIAPTGSISIIAGASSGIEPLFAVAYQHKVKDESLDRTLTFFNPQFETKATQMGILTDELRNEIAKKGTLQDIKEIPESLKKVFVTAHEIEPVWHIKAQAAFQKYTENAVSKTINLIGSATVEDVKQAYLLAWEQNCKGITVFRDGSKDKQVLNVGIGKTTDTEFAKPWVRPVALVGSTFKIKTPVGTAFITVNRDENTNPVEVFINVGRAGSDVQAMAEALGRIISKSLKFASTLSPRERAFIIIDQLKGIGGRRSVGFGPNKILSLPDAVAVALSSDLGIRLNGNGFETEVVVNGNGQEHEPLIMENIVGDICPSCGSSSFVYEEGCSKCHACGHSEC